MSEDPTLLNRRCPMCSAVYEPGQKVCPADGTILMPMRADKLVGKTFEGKYRIVSEIGRGGMSVVYRAVHELMHRDVAIKLLLSQDEEDPSVIMRFQREAMAASCLNHPNITTVYDFGMSENGVAYLVMDYLEGKPLDEVIRAEGHVEPGRAVDIMLQVVDALAHAHEKGVIHRDLKPSNIMLTRGTDGVEHVKVVDFGIAKLLETSGKTPQKLTSTYEVFGTPIYMSPEQIQSQPLDIRSDIYSAGAVLYELLAGVPPFQGRTSNETMSFHISRDPLPFAKLPRPVKVPAALESLVLKSLAKKPDDRFQSMHEFRDALDRSLGASGKIHKPSQVKRAGFQLGTDRALASWSFALVMAVVALVLLFTGNFGKGGINSVSSKSEGKNIGSVEGVIYYYGPGADGQDLIVHGDDGIDTRIGLANRDISKLAGSPRYLSNGARWHVAFSTTSGINEILPGETRSLDSFDANVRAADQLIREHYANMGRKHYKAVYADFSSHWRGLRPFKTYTKEWDDLKVSPDCQNAPAAAIKILQAGDREVKCSVDLSYFVPGDTNRYLFVCAREDGKWKLRSADVESE